MSNQINLKEKIDSFIEKHKEEFFPILQELCRFPSEHGKEYDVQAYLKQKFEEIGYKADMVPIDNSIKNDPEYTTAVPEISFKNRPNLVVKIPGTGDGKSVIFNSHNDVVPAKGWEKAYKPEIKGDKIIGRGVCDDKHGAVLQYMMALFLKENNLEPVGDIIFEIVIDEEVGGNGTLSLLRQGYCADGVIVLEFSNLNINAGARGALWFRAEFKGKSAHMSQIHLGISAIDRAMHFVELMKDYQKRLRKDGEGLEMFPYEPVPAQVNIGTIKGGDWPASVPASCVIEGGVGFLPPKTCADIKKEMAEIIENDSDPYFRENVKLSFPGLHNDPYELDKNHPVVKTLEKALRRSGWEPKIIANLASSDARLFANIGKIPTVNFSPPRNSGNVHGSEENNSLKDILDSLRGLLYFLEEWCGLKMKKI